MRIGTAGILLLAMSYFSGVKTEMPHSAKELQVEPLFNTDSCLSLSLESDFRFITRNMETDTLEHPGTLRYTDENGVMHALDVRIEVRGHFRRSRDNCTFPPLRIFFKKKQTAGTVFAGQSKLKLVTHCRTRQRSCEQNLLLEYIIYRMYNEFTDLSYRVRLANIRYINNTGRRDTIEKYAFFLEDRDHLLKRTNTKHMELQNVHPDATDSAHVNMLSVFQYMVGNTDWSIPAIHNITLVERLPKGPLYAIPFDFEWAGLINARYAKPQPMLGITSVRQRLFRGYCRTPQQFEATFGRFREKRPQLTFILKNTPALEDKVRAQAMGYLDEFYEIIDNPARVKREFLNPCR